MARADQNKPQPRSSHTPAIYVVLLLLTFAVYFQTWKFDFVGYDDPQITENYHITRGLTLEGAVWAFTSGDAANWFPVTRLSHMLDFQLFGARSGWHHLTNVTFHALAALLLFAFLHRATGALWRSVLVAFLFALHPLHVESVAWISERKDVLCAFFWFLTLWTYVRYAEYPTWGRYLLVLVSFTLGLMSKPMIVTLPFVLLLLDAWPLERLRLWDRVGSVKTRAAITWKRALWEKVPLLALSAGSAAITYTVQKSFGAVERVSALPIGMRAGNALISYGAYIVKMFWPTDLAVLYPYPPSLPAGQFVLALIAVGGVSILGLRSFRRRPYLAVGWLWYLGTLIPVIGLVQVGIQAHADRYTYIPMVGLSIMLAWGAADLVKMWPRTKAFAVAALAAACFLAPLVTLAQLPHWKNSEALFRRAIEVTEGNYAMHYDLGITFSRTGRVAEAVSEYETALRINPEYFDAHRSLGTALAEMPGRLLDAVSEDRAALRIKPDSADAHYNLGVALAKTPGRLAEAISEYEAALRTKPDFTDAHVNLGVALAQIPGRLPEAISEYEAALRIAPNYAEVHNNLGLALAQIPGRLPEAIEHYQAALRIHPDYAEAHLNLGSALAAVPGRLPEAISEYQAALQIRPDYADAQKNLAIVQRIQERSRATMAGRN